jgi:SAM-dependent methyltransferase
MAHATEASLRDALVERLFQDALGTFELAAVYLGERLGLYQALAAGPCSSRELASEAGVAERYAREWLEQQAAVGILQVEDAAAAPSERRFRLPAPHAEVLAAPGSLFDMTPMARLVVGCLRPLDALLRVYREGGGVPYADYGEDVHAGQAAFTGPIFDASLGTEWLPALPDVHERLLDEPPARIADLACGHGHSSIAMARAYSRVRVDGLDMDAASIARARRVLEGSGVEDRVAFHQADAADPGLRGSYDLVTVFEALHDMSRPVEVLRAAREMLVPGGSVIVGDERVADEFDPPAGEVERLYYGFSILHCLPVGMVGDDPAGTGTVMRAGTLRDYAAQAGFSDLEVLPIENEFYRFYRLYP